MNYFITLVDTFVLSVLIPANVLCKLNAVTDFPPWYVSRLYLEEERNLVPPSVLDQTTQHPIARLRVCEDISRSGVFASYGLNPVVMKDVHDELQRPQYLDIFHRIYFEVPESPQHDLYEYYNPYRRTKFDITEYFPDDLNAEPETIRKEEYVFTCLLKVADSDEEYVDDEEFDQRSFSEEDPEGDVKKEVSHESFTDEDEFSEENSNISDGSSEEDSNASDEKNPGDLIPFYVSKLYDVRKGLRAHRFVLLEKGKFGDEEVMLVEKSARAYVGPDFNVESHYLELRSHRRPVRNYEEDPVCRLNLGYFQNNQLFRLCAIVLTSAYFKDKVEYPHRVHHQHCFNRKISFGTTKGKQVAAGKSYNEYMLACETRMVGGDEEIFFISRAYNPNQAFVYTETNGKLYLETLVTNVSIVHELYTFRNREI